MREWERKLTLCTFAVASLSLLREHATLRIKRVGWVEARGQISTSLGRMLQRHPLLQALQAD